MWCKVGEIHFNLDNVDYISGTNPDEAVDVHFSGGRSVAFLGNDAKRLLGLLQSHSMKGKLVGRIEFAEGGSR